MAVFCKFCLLALMVASAESVKIPGSTYKTAGKQERDAQSIVASLLRQRANGASAKLSSSGVLQWIPASSLEAEQGAQSQEEGERIFRAEFEEVLGEDLLGVFEKDLKSIQAELKSTFMAMPKNEYGDLGHTAVRYSLHRLFVARHGWYIQGLDPEGSNFNVSSPSEILKGRLPDHTQRFVEKLLYGRGFGLYEVAVLAAVLENLIHQEAIERTAAVFAMHDLDLEGKVAPEQVDFAIDHYMALYIMGQDATSMTKEQVATVYSQMNDAYPGWEDTRSFARKIREDAFGTNSLTFNETVGVLIEMGEKYGRWQQRECVAMKKQLMDLEDQKDGCVPVSHFYKPFLTKGRWQFSESSDYLRNLGALDDSDSENLRVMIPNYLDGASNCVASSSYYSVCCINECEEILGRLEHQVQAPDASPEELARAAAALGSSTVKSGRTLPAALLRRLDHIAEVHGGRVPLHSRLFMQWMHNAFPHECPYPHLSGATRPRPPEAWMADTHKDSIASKREMTEFVQHESTIHRPAQCGQWLDQEELYVPWATHPAKADSERESHAWSGALSVGLLGAVASMILMLIQTSRAMRGASGVKHVAI